ncbi:site-2 protease family protein [Clostridium sp. A1-XYC3]|uniref:Site-2 protease family protein n=1 Tax=Clostridium tanneri TaxID=3037988 RepID=A0ABU4JTP8_9CLOT|nr:site-2 protease family protein [Clostridium sp. A1-XYC3]MDW8801513.1 site-2 protease family protein [Clostridium sp. A1-XYC3]
MDDNSKIEVRNENGVDFVTIAEDTEKAKKKKKGILAALGVGVAALAKLKIIGKLGFIFLKLKGLIVFLKLGKLLSTFGSMMLMIWVYAKIYGMAFAAGFVLLIFMHEMGHYFAAKKINLKVSAPIFIPFVGAFISMKEEPKDAKTEAWVAIGGPLLGSISAVGALAVYYYTKQELFLALAYTGFILNLFNLIPVHPLDGGRIVTAISPALWILGIPVMIFALIKSFNSIILIFLIMGAVQIYKYYKDENKKYYEVDKSARLFFAITYFGMIALLGLLSAYLYNIAPKNF